MTKAMSWLAVVVCLMNGCSDSSDSSPGATAGTTNAAGAGASGAAGAGTGGTVGDGGAPGTSGSGGTNTVGLAGTAGVAGAATAKPTTPQLAAIEPMQGALHVMWTNKQDDCDTIEGERKTDTDPYAVAFTVPGEADNKHDMSATKDTTYTYRLRCKKGDAYSEYSNEMSRNPTK